MDTAREPIRFLISRDPIDRRHLRCCPTASSLLCRELESGREALIAIPCRRWGCAWCGPRAAFKLAIRTEQAKPTKFITLTVNPAHWSDPREAFKKTSRKVSALTKAIRLRHSTCSYLRVLEATKKGWPHYHLVARCGYVPQAWLSDKWAELTGANVVDIRAIGTGTNVFKYVLKYLTKQTYIPWTNRRISWSRDFFPPPASDEHRQNPFINRRRHPKHPEAVLQQLYHGRLVTSPKPGVYLIESTLDSQNPELG